MHSNRLNRLDSVSQRSDLFPVVCVDMRIDYYKIMTLFDSTIYKLLQQWLYVVVLCCQPQQRIAQSCMNRFSLKSFFLSHSSSRSQCTNLTKIQAQTFVYTCIPRTMHSIHVTRIAIVCLWLMDVSNVRNLTIMFSLFCLQLPTILLADFFRAIPQMK